MTDIKHLRAAILTAVEVETNAIRDRIRDRRSVPDTPGVVLYETGTLDTPPATWDVILLETRQDNEPTAVLTERVIRDTAPDVVIFFGVAGRLKDASHGDIVVATGAYSYARGKETSGGGFGSRPDPLPATQRLISVATYLRDHHAWRRRIRLPFRSPPPRVYIGPIASGPLILEDILSDTVKMIRDRYNDALAVDKESLGFLTAHRYNHIDACVVRAISDFLSDKQDADLAGKQKTAAERGAAFVIGVLDTYTRFFDPARNIVLDERTPRRERRPLRAAAVSTSIQVRAALTPYLLPPVPRPMVKEVLIPAVSHSWAASRARVIPLIAPAGYGKSTILGQLYDELSRAEGASICLLRCDDIPTDYDVERNLPAALGHAATGLQCDVLDLTMALLRGSRNSAVLVDTLDQILAPSTVPPLRKLLLALAEQNVTVVFTCRDFDYASFLEPPGITLPGIEVDRHTVPPFSEDEIAAAARMFLVRLETRIDDHAIAVFVQHLLDLAVDRRRVLEIVTCPLLLALLCESYGHEGVLPSDLSVTKLYDTHWNRKVFRGRVAGDTLARGRAREQYALSVAEECFLASRDRLHDTIDRADLHRRSDIPEEAGHDLLSANILQQPRSGRLRFFHQTFLEYTLARWLGTEAHRPARISLLNDLRERRAGSHWWPTIRQLVARCNTADDVQEILAALNLSEIAPFRAAAFGACSRADGAGLATLEEYAQDDRTEHQITLLEALSGSPPELRNEAWRIAIRYLSGDDKRVEGAASEALGALLGQPSEDQGYFLTDLFKMIGDDTVGAPRSGNAAKSFVGSVLQVAYGLRRTAPAPEILAMLRRGFVRLGRHSQGLVLRLHRLDGASATDRSQLFENGRTAALNAVAFDEANAFTRQLVEELLIQATNEVDQIRSLLRLTYPDGWRVAVPRAIGAWLGTHDQTVPQVWNALIGHEAAFGPGIIALSEAAKAGACTTVVNTLLEIDARSLTPGEARGLCALIVAIAAELSPREKQRLGQWLPALQAVPAPAIVPALVALASESLEATQQAMAILRRLSETGQARLIMRSLRSAPAPAAALFASEILDLLGGLPSDIDVGLARVAAASLIADTSTSAATTLLAYCQSAARTLSSSAIQAVLRIPPDQLLPQAPRLPTLLTSQYPYVRTSTFHVLRGLVPRGLPAPVALSALQRAGAPSDSPTLQALMRFLGDAAILLRSEPTETLTPIARTLVAAVLRDKDPGTIRTGIRTCIPIAWEWGSEVRSIIAAFAETVLSTTDLTAVSDGERAMIDLLAVIARHDNEILARLTTACHSWHARNVRALACAIKRCEGGRSALLDGLIDSPHCPLEVTTAILEWRRA